MPPFQEYIMLNFPDTSQAKQAVKYVYAVQCTYILYILRQNPLGTFLYYSVAHKPEKPTWIALMVKTLLLKSLF